MPDLSTRLHLDMLEEGTRQRSLRARLTRARRAFFAQDLYGMEWGDPAAVPPLQFFRKRFLLPYVRSDHVALEIGPGGGRWTRDLLGFGKLYVVDYHEQSLAELRKSFRSDRLVSIKNTGTDFPGVPDESVDYLFSFGLFVHLEPDLIDAYLHNLRRVVRPGANVVIQYADNTKTMAQINRAFVDTTPESIRAMVRAAGYEILEEDLTSLWHSSVMRFAKPGE